MKRVLIFSLAYYPHVGGAEVALKEITDRISDIEFHMVTMRFSADDAREEKIGNIFVHRIGFGSAYLSKVFFVPLAALSARRLHRQHTFDLFWAMMTYMTFPIVLGRILSVRVPYVLTLQDGDPFDHVFERWYIRPFAPLLSWGFKNAIAVTALSNYLAMWARQIGYKGDIAIVPNGVNTKQFDGAPIAHEGVVMVSTSRLVHKNALDDVIRTLAFLPADVVFHNYGFGPDKEKLLELARTLGVDSRVKLFPHPGVPELPPYLHAADIFIRPSRSEGFGISFMEGMAAGLPVIATQEGGIADFLFDAKRNPDRPTTGWAVDKDSPGQIADAVKDILAHPEEVARVTATAKKLALENYDWDTIARDMREKMFDRFFTRHL